MEREGPRLLFVYNADGGPVSAMVDALHKLVSPQTYSCSLCAITYGAVSMRREWKRYLATLPYAAEFLHRDEFAQRWPGWILPLPAILLERGGSRPELLVGADEMDRRLSVAELSAALDRALARQPGQLV